MSKLNRLSCAVTFILLLGGGLVGCADDPCEVIVDKINECQGTDLEANPNCDDDLYECQADCYDDASCDEITGQVPAPNAFQDCITACGPMTG